MTTPFKGIAGLERLVHEPSRLAILTALSACESADFQYLQRLTGLTKGNLSSHLGKLEEGGLVVIEKTFRGRTPSTTLRLTASGSETIEAYWKTLEDLRAGAATWRPRESPT